MNCHVCSKTNDYTAIFCVYCGVRLERYQQQAATSTTIDLRRRYVPRMTSADPSHANTGWYPRADTPLNANVQRNDNTDQHGWLLGGLFDWLF